MGRRNSNSPTTPSLFRWLLLRKNLRMKILDIDLDFFLNNKHCGTVTSVRRLSSKNFKPWTEQEVQEFLESNCGLKKMEKVSGKFFKHHDELFYFLRKLQEQADFSLTFSIDHIDAHGDLGTGDASYRYIATEILSRPLKGRAYPDKINGLSGLGAGNFLAFAIACRWIDSLKYINNIEWTDDTQWFNFKNFDTESNIIQLKQFSEKQMDKMLFGNMSDMRETARSILPLAYEPEVPFEVIDYKKYKNIDKYDFVFLTHSPGFTPKGSDNLIPIIKQYIGFDID
jgi:hypothetical protein